MSQQFLAESQEKAKQRIASRKTSPASAQSFNAGHHPVPQLQRTLGNRNVAKLIQTKQLTPEGKIIGLQRKLTVGAADDQYEQEADRVARQVMNTSDAAVAANSMQRAMSPEEDKDKMLQTKPLAASITPFVQREMVNNEEPEDKEKPVQAKFLTGTNREPLQRQPETEEEEKKPIQTKSAGAQRAMSPEEDKDKMLQTKPLAASITPFVQREMVNNEEPEDKEKPVQAKSAGSMSGSFEAGDDVESQVSQSKGHGSPLPDPVRAYMEPRFGVDFGGVRVHTGSDALQMNQNVGAQAFTHDSDIYYGDGRSPSNLELTAHELTHVVQQGSVIKPNHIQKRGIGDGHDLQSPRFAGNASLEDAFDFNTGGRVIKKNDKGLPVRILQQALVDAGFPLPVFGVDGDFGNETETKVKSFQQSQGLTGSAVDGKFGTVTMGLLDTYFLNHGALVTIPQSQVPSTAPTEGVEWPSGGAPAELLSGTRALKANEKAEIEKRRTTEVQAPVGGTLPDFHSHIVSTPDSYEKRIEDITTMVVDAQFAALGKDKGTMHMDPTKLHQWSDIEKVAEISKRETDRVFGNFATGKAFKQGINIKDAWDDKESQFAAGGAAFEQASVEWRVNKIIQDPDVTGTIDLEHGAVQSRTTLSPGEAKSEADIITGIRNRIIASKRAELIEIHKGWPGYADPATRTVFIQRFKESSADKNRDFMWDMFQTLVHEYIHTLAHSEYMTYADSLPEKKGGKTYREGMTEYFTKIVLESLTINAAFRKDVEGPFHDPLVVHHIPVYGGYGEAANAEAVAGVAGLRNVMAAFFLGKIKLIGG